MNEQKPPKAKNRPFRKNLAFWLSVALVAAGCGRIDPAQEMAAAVESFAAGRHSEAAIRLSNVIQAEPTHAEAWKLRGDLALVSGDPAMAAEAFERARALGTPLESLAIGLAEARNSLGQASEALSILDSAAESLEDDPRYWVTRAEALVRSRRPAEAEIALASGANVGSGGTRADIVRALIALARNDAAAAEAILGSAIAGAPDDAALLAARGELYARSERLDSAAGDLLRAADLYRDASLIAREIAALSALAQVNLARNDLDAAEATASRIAQRSPNAALTAYVRGLVHYRRGSFDEAARVLQPLVNAQPDNVLFRSLLGAVHLGRGDLGQAEQQFLAVLAVSPRDPLAVKLVAETRLRQQRPEAALSALRIVDDAIAQDSQLGFLSGLASLQLGNTQQGLFYLEQAASLDPANELIKLQLARAYLVAGRDADASALLEGSLGSGSTALDARLIRLFADFRRGGSDATEAEATALLEEFPRDPRVLTAIGGYFQMRGDAERALDLFRQAAALETEGAMARLFVAASLVRDGRSDEAERLLATVNAQQPDNVQVLAALAELRVARGALNEAAELLTRAAEHSTSVMPRLLLAQLHLRAGNLAEAKRESDAAAQSAPNDPEVLAVAGTVALAENRTSDAVRALQRAYQQLPNRLNVALALARAQLADESPEAARNTLTRALEAAPKSLPLRVALGQTELRLGNADEAMSIAASIKADLPAHSAGYLLEADAQIAGRRYAAAADNLSSAFEREPTWAVSARLVRVLELAGRPNQAMTAAERWVAANPEHVPGRVLLGSMLQTAGRVADALRVFEDVLAIDGRNIVALNNAAWISHSLDRPGALAFAERAHALASDNPAVLDTLGWILLEENRVAESIVHLRRAAELAPGVPEIQYHFAKALVTGGRPSDARPVLSALLAGPDFEQRSEARQLLDSL